MIISFRKLSRVSIVRKGLLYDNPSVPVKLLENVMLQIRKHTMDVKLRRDERRRLHIEIPDGMGISLQFSNNRNLKMTKPLIYLVIRLAQLWTFCTKTSIPCKIDL